MHNSVQSWSVFHQQAPRKSVSVGAMVRRDNAILFVHQTYGVLQGQWSLPTGFAEAEEPPEVTALRETREEAGIEAALDGLLAICTVDWEGDKQIYLVFLCHHVAGEPTADGVENDRAAYFSLSKLEAAKEPFEVLSSWIARRVLHDQYQVLRPASLASLASYYGTAFL